MELGLSPISARDTHVTLGKSLYLSRPSFLPLGLCGELGNNIWHPSHFYHSVKEVLLSL